MLNKKERLFTSLLFLTISLFLCFDIYEDIQEGASLTHVTEEAFIMLLGFIGVLTLWLKWLITRRENKQISVNFIQLKDDLSHYKDQTRDLSQGIAEKIQAQLDSWQLTKSEKDIALFLLKGLTIREIAEIRNTSEKTIKQHCTNLYSKSNLSGRSELSAFFLEDILVIV